MRQPSIHIPLKVLGELMKTLFEVNLTPKNLEQLAYTSRKHALNSRKILVSNKKIAKQVDSVVLPFTQSAGLFIQLLVQIRKKRNHKGISIPKMGSTEWPIIKEITQLAIDFCKEFNLQQREGFIQYITIGMDKMNRFNLNKFKGVHESIHDTYIALQDLRGDSNPHLTETSFRVYQKIVLDKIGFCNDYKQLPDKYVFFLKCHKEATRLGVSVDIYIKAQFEGFGFRNGIPDPIQLVGPKAEERLKNYLYENNISIQERNQKSVNWANVKNVK